MGRSDSTDEGHPDALVRRLRLKVRRPRLRRARAQHRSVLLWVLVIGMWPVIGAMNTTLTMWMFQGSMLWGLFLSSSMFGLSLPVLLWMSRNVPTSRPGVPQLAALSIVWGIMGGPGLTGAIDLMVRGSAAVPLSEVPKIAPGHESRSRIEQRSYESVRTSPRCT